jgi:PP-loop superfamily ATP-utilizing enzyme
MSLSDADALERKEAALDLALRELPSLIIAYSGGVDSAYVRHRRQPQLS